MSELTAPIFLEGHIDLFLRRRVCARCYGDLESRPSKDYSASNHEYEAYCPECGDAWNYATVSRHYAEHLGQQAIAENWEIKDNLPDLFPSKHKGKSNDQLLEELGF